MITIRDLDEQQSPAAAILLARAFDDEPVFLASFPDPAERAECLLPLFEADVRNACRYGGAHSLHVDNSEPIGIAYWTYQPEPERSDEEMAELGFAQVFARWGAELGPVSKAESESHHQLRYLIAPWRYLAGIGVLPEHQGQGHGTALLHHVISGATAAGQSLALSTDRAINVKLYERVGFKVVHYDADAALGVPFWTMLHSHL